MNDKNTKYSIIPESCFAKIGRTMIGIRPIPMDGKNVIRVMYKKEARWTLKFVSGLGDVRLEFFEHGQRWVCYGVNYDEAITLIMFVEKVSRIVPSYFVISQLLDQVLHVLRPIVGDEKAIKAVMKIKTISDSMDEEMNRLSDVSPAYFTELTGCAKSPTPENKGRKLSEGIQVSLSMPVRRAKLESTSGDAA